MNTARFRSKRVIVSTTAAIAALAVGGVVWGSAASADLTGADRDRVAEAAVAEAGGGRAVEVEEGDPGEEAYEVEVRKDDGAEVEVRLDQDLNVIGRDDDSDDRDDDADGPDADDRVLSDAERTSAEEAALRAVEGGTVVEVEASDDRGEAYEVSVLDADGKEWDVDLDANFEVVLKHVDR
jgi:uncharacterized membrane protein YkoI